LNQLIVFPTSRAIRKYVLDNSHKNTLLPKLISIDELFSNSIHINDKKYIDENLRIIYLKQAVDFVEFDVLGINRSMQEFFRQSEFIFRFLGELAHEDIDIDTLEQYDTYAHYLEHLNILKKVKQNYLDILNTNNLVDKLNLPQQYTLNPDYINSFSSIHIVLEGYLSKFEYSIIKQISTINDTSLEFSYNKFNEKSILQINNNILNLQIDHNYKINLSTNTILEETYSKYTKSEANLYPFEARIDQIGFINYCIYDSIKNHNIQAEDIVVVLPDETFAPILKLFDKQRYFNFAFGFDIKNTHIYKTIIAINSYQLDPNNQTNELLEFLDIAHENEFLIHIKQQWNKPTNQETIDKLNLFIQNSTDSEEIKLSVEKTIFTLWHVLSSNCISINLKDLFKIIILKLNKLTIDDTSGGKITVMGLLETRSMNFKSVIVCDFNDHIVPKRSTKDKFLSTHIKELASLPTATHRQNLQAYYYDKLFKKSSRLYISYVQSDTSSLSRFANKLINYDNNTLQINNQFKNILYTQNNIDIIDESIILDIDLSKRSWSASSFGIYLKCKRKYYLQYILKIKEHHFSLKPQGFELGTIIHDILEDIYKKQSSFLNYDELYNQIIYNINQEKVKNPYLIFDIELLKKKLSKFVKNEISRFQNGIIVKECEKEFKITHNNIVLSGKIDRIDQNNNGSYDIIDYKTSKNLKIDTSRTYKNSKDFQLEFYYLALQSYKISNVCYYDLNKGQLFDEDMLDEKLILLDEKLDELHTSTVDFTKCEDKKECVYCPYKTICQRD
jgi:inactivated superfamily I helicase/CRISPR/Cas system-associated exonuclease Cas4 (RecB family)